MRTKFHRGIRLVLASLVLICSGAFASIALATPPPLLTLHGLIVNEENRYCGATVQTGDQVCVSYSSNQNANVSVTLQKDSGPIQPVSSGTIVANAVNQTCVSAGTADGIVRTFRVTINNSHGSDYDTCTYVVGNSSPSNGPEVTVLGLRVNGTNNSCGATAMTGDQVCVRFRSNQNGNAIVYLTNGPSTRVVSSGPVTAGVVYLSCVNAGVADGVTRIFTVRVSNSYGTDTETCDYHTAGPSPTGPNVTIVGLRVDGAYTSCGATADYGDQICVRFTSSQNGNATVSVKKGTTTTFVASGSVSAGPTYIACTASGPADNIVRTFLVKVQNANGSETEMCNFTVSP